MRPLALHGHTRPVTQVKYNREGDLIFSSSKDTIPTVWSSLDGTRLGTYEGHTGAVWGLDVNESSTLLATAGADSSTRIWEVETGVEIARITHPNACRAVSWAHGDRMLLAVTDQSMGQTAALNIYNIPERGDIAGNKCEFNVATQYRNPEKINHAMWGPSNDTIYFCCEDGAVCIYDVETGKEKASCLAHDGVHCKRINWDSDYGMLATAGWDKTSKLLDGRDCSVIQTYNMAFNANEAVVVNNSVMNHVITGGGIDAQSVTNTGAHQNKFEMKFYHKVFGEELGGIGGHFGPVNSLSAEPNGNGFASGGEDGFIRLHHFDADYYDSPGKPDEFAS
eukprot:TRINITY_DN459_c1_g2_i1.p1 TRINITY_DN459_c1_g2~~TRINITY_DN459_c1_g2_i1.p1  ORF type:complete len:337 (+),score=63.68 TRINITY_DN459_c1_g2_i1:72-1082(+)